MHKPRETDSRIYVGGRWQTGLPMVGGGGGSEDGGSIISRHAQHTHAAPPPPRLHYARGSKRASQRASSRPTKLEFHFLTSSSTPIFKLHFVCAHFVWLPSGKSVCELFKALGDIFPLIYTRFINQPGLALIVK